MKKKYIKTTKFTKTALFNYI